jgi:hypothetical protein
MKRSQEPRCMTEVSHLKKSGQRLKIYEDYTFCKKVMAIVFWDFQGVLFIDFLTEQRPINTAYCSELLKDRVKPAFRSKLGGRSVRSVCLHDKANARTPPL